VTPEEAIKILAKFHDKAACSFDASSALAFQLGIEALGREKLLREMVRFNTLKQAREAWKYAIAPLPSEDYISEDVGKLPSDEM